MLCCPCKEFSENCSSKVVETGSFLVIFAVPHSFIVFDDISACVVFFFLSIYHSLYPRQLHLKNGF